MCEWEINDGGSFYSFGQRSVSMAFSDARACVRAYVRVRDHAGSAPQINVFSLLV